MQTLWYHYDFDTTPLGISVLAMNLGQEGGDAATRTSDTQYMQTVGTHLKFNPGSWNFRAAFIIRRARMLRHGLFLLTWEAYVLYIISIKPGRSMQVPII